MHIYLYQLFLILADCSFDGSDFACNLIMPIENDNFYGGGIEPVVFEDDAYLATLLE